MEILSFRCSARGVNESGMFTPASAFLQDTNGQTYTSTPLLVDLVELTLT